MQVMKWLAATALGTGLFAANVQAQEAVQAVPYEGWLLCGDAWQCDLQQPLVPSASGQFTSFTFEGYGNWTGRVGIYTGNPEHVAWLTPSFPVVGNQANDLTALDIRVVAGVTIVFNLTSADTFGASARGNPYLDPAGPAFFMRAAYGASPLDQPFMRLDGHSLAHTMVIQVPEPHAYALLLAGLAVVGAWRRYAARC